MGWNMCKGRSHGVVILDKFQPTGRSRVHCFSIFKCLRLPLQPTIPCRVWRSLAALSPRTVRVRVAQSVLSSVIFLKAAVCNWDERCAGEDLMPFSYCVRLKIHVPLASNASLFLAVDRNVHIYNDCRYTLVWCFIFSVFVLYSPSSATCNSVLVSLRLVYIYISFPFWQFQPHFHK